MEPFLAKARELDETLILHLKHIILSHHGEYEFGSPRRPKTPRPSSCTSRTTSTPS